MRRRRGITLIEVLVAIFIMAIGLLAILTLFPLGALRMSESLQSDRTAASASAAANTADAFGLRSDLSFTADYYTPPPSPQNYPPTAQTGPGFPVFVDPYGVLINGPTLGASTLTNPPTPGCWRVVPSVMPPTVAEPNALVAPLPARYFTLPDDMTFGTNGGPETSSGVVQRGGRYTWGYMLHNQHPYQTPSNVSVDLAVVVYAGRATSVPGGENTYAASGGVGSTAVTITWNPAAQPTPNLRRGSWILDTSYNPITSSVHGDFYRVVAVTQPAAGTLNVELQTAISKSDGVTAVTVMDNLVEVFERGVGDSTRWEFRTESQ